MAAVGYTSGDPGKVDVGSVGQVGGPAGPLDASGLIPAAQIPGGGGGGGPSLAGTVTSETAYGAAASAGSASTASRGDHTHGTPALASTAPSSSAVGDAAAVGTGTTPARADHVHGREAFGSVTAQTSYGAASGSGSAVTPARSDHTHGTPALPTASQVGAVPADSTITVAPSVPLMKHQRNFAVDSSTKNVDEVWVNGTLTGWRNEWGAYRGQPAYNWDAVLRMVAHATQSGNIAEYQNNARTQVLWGVNAAGKVVQGNGSAAAVTMSPVYVAAASDVLPGALPAGLPAGTVIIQQTS